MKVEGKVVALEDKINNIQKSLNEFNLSLQRVMHGVHHMQDKGNEPKSSNGQAPTNRG